MAAKAVAQLYLAAPQSVLSIDGGSPDDPPDPPCHITFFPCVQIHKTRSKPKQRTIASQHTSLDTHKAAWICSGTSWNIGMTAAVHDGDADEVRRVARPLGGGAPADRRILFVMPVARLHETADACSMQVERRRRMCRGSLSDSARQQSVNPISAVCSGSASSSSPHVSPTRYPPR